MYKERMDASRFKRLADKRKYQAFSRSTWNGDCLTSSEMRFVINAT
jgi:hypothetical protein